MFPYYFALPFSSCVASSAGVWLEMWERGEKAWQEVGVWGARFSLQDVEVVIPFFTALVYSPLLFCLAIGFLCCSDVLVRVKWQNCKEGRR